MKSLSALIKRNFLETVRDPLSLIFCAAFPLVMLIFMNVTVGNLDGGGAAIFKIDTYAPAICVFGYTFTMMFTAMQIAGDKNTSFIKRIKISPVGRVTYLMSFVFAAMPIAFLQTVLFFIVAVILKYPFNAKILLTFLYLIPSAFLYVSLGVLIGELCSDEKKTGPVCSIIVSVTSILGGIFMPVEILSGAMEKIANALPFKHSVEIASKILIDGAAAIYPNIIYVLAYAVAAWVAIFVIEKIKSTK